MFYVTQKTFEHGNKAGHLLAYLTRPDHTPISIPWILTPQGHVSDIVRPFYPSTEIFMLPESNIRRVNYVTTWLT